METWEAQPGENARADKPCSGEPKGDTKPGPGMPPASQGASSLGLWDFRVGDMGTPPAPAAQLQGHAFLVFKAPLGHAKHVNQAR